MKNSIAARPIVARNFTRNPVMKHLPHAELEVFGNSDVIHTEGLFIGNHHYEMGHEFELLEKSLRLFLSR